MNQATQGAHLLEAGDVAVAALLVIVAGVVSLVMRLDLHRRLLLASIRTVVQLVLIGHILRWLFEIDNIWVLSVVLVVMMVNAGIAAVGRSDRTFPGVTYGAIFALVITGLATTFTVTGAIIGKGTWHEPQYLIPLMGMVLGNTLTGISLCLDSLLETLDQQASLIEMELCHGSSRWEAARGFVSQSVRRGMIPIINAMMVVGIVSLPGMMTGQILAGTEPLEAVKYQMVVMFMLAASCALASILMAFITYRRLFNDRHQLRRDLIKKRS
jgi:putative ABC transport system permease protein